ncbi:MAG: glycosyl transferase [SAR324 cluster bacterium]|uniref:Glycosyl transferase n=1 Tax=SAR324 cluster bacterium TaxID=2024889 RepID=A0A2A4T442_9DELT|nr:MAG: glycosyl transferase [SAR324 cluster bacterium]
MMINNVDDKFETFLLLSKRNDRKGEGGLRKKGYSKRSYKNKPLISIVTVVFNGEEFLEETIQSVANQTYDNVEYIIIDGGSVDETLDIIKKYEEQIDYWVSEKDNGIYDAMNKAIEVYFGEYIWFLNAGDTIYDSNVITNMFHCSVDADIFYGATQLVDQDGEFIKLIKQPENFNLKSLTKGMVVSHQSVVVKRKFVFPYNLKYKFVSDHDWLINASRDAKSFQDTSLTMSKYLLDGFSQNNFFGCWKDRLAIVSMQYGRSVLLLNYILFIKALLKNTLKKALQSFGLLK